MPLTSSHLRVAVIGAGAAGLCAGRHLVSYSHRFEFDIFEQQKDVGGTWRYSDKVGVDEHGLPVHSSMYKNLRTNLPKEIMAFPDFQFKTKDCRSFVHHSDVLVYLEEYAKHFSLYEHIKFQHYVLNVEPMKIGNNTEWIILIQDLKSNVTFTKTYDAVMVCNGHYSVPYIPEALDFTKFKGLLIHSHDYRDSEKFIGLKVVILGAGASGVDIALEVATVAKEVILSHNKPVLTCPLPENLLQANGIEYVEGHNVKFVGGQICGCDAVILCTGYLYSYPFLHPKCGVEIGDQRVSPLFMHLLLISNPSLAIWAVPKLILPFPIYNQQVIVFLKYLKGDIVLPCEEEMRCDAQKDFCLRAELGLKPHLMSGELQWQYDDKLSKLGKIPPLPDSTRKLYKHIHSLRNKDIINYKKANFDILDGRNFLQTI